MPVNGVGGLVNGVDRGRMTRIGTPITAETTVSADVVNTTETLLVTYGTIPANFFTAEQGLMIRFSFRMTESGVAGPTFRFRIRVGGLTGDIVADSGVLLIPSGAQTNAAIWGEVFVQGITATTVWGTGQIIVPTGAALGTADICHPMGSGTLGTATAAAVTLSSVAAQTVVLTIEYSTNTAGNSVSAGPGCYAVAL